MKPTKQPWEVEPTFLDMLRRRRLTLAEWIRAESVTTWEQLLEHCVKMQLVPPPETVWQKPPAIEIPDAPPEVVNERLGSVAQQSSEDDRKQRAAPDRRPRRGKATEEQE